MSTDWVIEIDKFSLNLSFPIVSFSKEDKVEKTLIPHKLFGTGKVIKCDIKKFVGLNASLNLWPKPNKFSVLMFSYGNDAECSGLVSVGVDIETENYKFVLDKLGFIKSIQVFASDHYEEQFEGEVMGYENKVSQLLDKAVPTAIGKEVDAGISLKF